MDDRELEGRIRTHFHRRFDDAPLPTDLTSNVRQAFATSPRRVGFDLRAGGLRFGWPAVAAAAVVAVAVAIAGNLGGQLGPGNRPSATPAPSLAADRYFIVLAPAGLPTKADSSLAGDVLNARIRALGTGNFTSAIGNAIQFIVPADGPSDDAIRAVLAATGDVEFVPLPAADYGDGHLTAVVGEALPKHESPLFGWEGIKAIATDSNIGQPALLVELKPAAAAAFGDYTAAHLGEYFAIVLDGRVSLLPVINEPIPGGNVTLSSGGPTIPGRPDPFAVPAAILVGGMLPEAWRGAIVPEIISREAAIVAARGSITGGADATVESADLDAIHGDSGWEPIWTVVLSRDSGPMKVILDARRGQ